MAERHRPREDRPRRDGQRPRREGEWPRREGDRPRPAGGRPRPEGEWPRREGDRPRPAAERWREGDRPRPGGRRPGWPAERQRPLPGRAAAPRPAPPPAVRREELVAIDEELVAGRRPVEESFASRREVRRLLVVPERRAALDALVLHATTLRIPVVEVEGGTLTSLTGFDGHQGVALVVGARPMATLDDVLARARERSQPPFVVVLDSLEDPQNLGTLLRSAEACGVHGVIFPTRRSAPLSPAAIKASAGATEHLLLLPVDDLPAAMADLRARGLRLVGADEGAALRYGEADLRGPLALVVGSEERGISGALRRRLDLLVRIPMHGRVASLNAAVAGSVLLFAAAEQRGLPEAGDEAPSVDEPPATADSGDPQPERAPRPRRTRRASPAVVKQPAEGEVAELLPGESPGTHENDLPDENT